MPFIENPAPPKSTFSKWVNKAVTALTTSLYDGSEDDIEFVQDGVMESLTDTIPPYAGSDNSLLTIEKQLGENDKLVVEFAGFGVSSSSSDRGVANGHNSTSGGGGLFSSQANNTLPSSSSSSLSGSCSSLAPSSSSSADSQADNPRLWTAVIETKNLGLVIDENGSEGSASYTSQPKHLFSNGTTFFSVGATTAREFGASLKCGPFAAKLSGAVEGGPSSPRQQSLRIHSCATSVKLALPDDLLCGHVLAPKYLANGACGRHLYLGCSWTGRNDVLRGAFAYTHTNFRKWLTTDSPLSAYLPESLDFGVWGAAVLYNNNRNGEEEDCVCVGGLKITNPKQALELCVGAEQCSNGDVETTFGLRKRFSNHFWFPYTVSVGRTTDRDWGASVTVSIVDFDLTLGAHKRSDAVGGFLGSLPTFGLHVSF